MPTFEFEKELKNRGYNAVCGIDEAGRGPLAGPVCAAAVILDENNIPEGLDDSKKLSEKKRELLYGEIIEKAVAYGIAFAEVSEIEEHNILGATFIAMKRAAEKLCEKPDYILVDGNRLPPDMPAEVKTVVKGDALSLSIAAASVLAKVTRDRYMCSLPACYDVYEFKKHKGYGTKAHIRAIKEYGASDIHRPSFLGKILNAD